MCRVVTRLAHTDLFEIYTAQVRVLAALAAEVVTLSELFLGTQELLRAVNLGAEPQGGLLNRAEVLRARRDVLA